MNPYWKHRVEINRDINTEIGVVAFAVRYNEKTDEIEEVHFPINTETGFEAELTDEQRENAYQVLKRIGKRKLKERRMKKEETGSNGLTSSRPTFGLPFGAKLALIGMGIVLVVIWLVSLQA